LEICTAPTVSQRAFQTGILCDSSMETIEEKQSHASLMGTTFPTSTRSRREVDYPAITSGTYLFIFIHLFIFEIYIAYRWVLHTCKKQKVIVFATDNDLRLAAQCDTLVGDATFLTCPKGFRQLYTVHAKV
jgi:hypothetical protein